jgi:hypothetical protein
MAQANPRRLQKLAALSIPDWRILLASMLLLPATALSLKMKGYTWTRKFLENLGKPRPHSDLTRENQLNEAQRITRLVSIAASYGIYRTNCLKIALVAQWLLQRKGIATNLRIGINNDLSLFSAHAWLEYDGEILIDSEDTRDRFTAFDSH